MPLIQVVFFIIWLYIVWIMDRANLYFFKFAIGSVGLFCFLMLWLQPLLIGPLSRSVAAAAGVMGNFSGWYDAYYQYALLFIPKNTTSVSLYIDYECSGVIEIMAFCCLLWFFPLYHPTEKLVISIMGAIIIFLANIFRIFLICGLIYFYGNNIYYFAHTIFGRVLFYSISIALYYFVFTRAHIIRQKVGRFDYGNHFYQDI